MGTLSCRQSCVCLLRPPDWVTASVLSDFKIGDFPSSVYAGCKLDEALLDARTCGWMQGGSRWRHALRCCSSGWEYACPCIDFLSTAFHLQFTALVKICTWRSLACLLKRRKSKSPLHSTLSHSQGKNQSSVSETRDYL